MLAPIPEHMAGHIADLQGIENINGSVFRNKKKKKIHGVPSNQILHMIAI